MRGSLDRTDLSSRIAEAQAELEAARRLVPHRPEADFNEARMLETFAHLLPSREALPALEQALKRYGAFQQLAHDDPRYAQAVAQAKECSCNLRDNCPFTRPGANAAAIEAARQEKTRLAQPAEPRPEQ